MYNHALWTLIYNKFANLLMIGSHFSHLYARWPPLTAVVQELEVAAAMDLHVQPGDNDNDNGKGHQKVKKPLKRVQSRKTFSCVFWDTLYIHR